MTNIDKLQFITQDFTRLIAATQPNTPPLWGKMNLQQMTEHVADFFKLSSGKLQMPIISTPEHLVKLKEFLYSDKPFRENTKPPGNILPEEPLPVRNPSIEIAISKLQHQIDAFVQYFQDNPEGKQSHPVFGELNFEEWVMLHYKHVTHHSRQFGLI
jgi:oxepin-CoA hydrolase/3-oxo-5,6-dehydrosuberyl-CoA semialdehyde dehydrogenase